MPAFLWIAPVPALGAALFASWDLPLVLDWAPYHVTLLLDGPGAILLTTASLLWIAAGAYAGSFFGDAAIGASFTVCWLLTLIGSVGIFLVADLPGFLVFYALVSLPAWAQMALISVSPGRRKRSPSMASSRPLAASHTPT